eukprot:COSAG01_NODE_3087_length_6609_cov_2.598925_2_plen_43_part_00
MPQEIEQLREQLRKPHMVQDHQGDPATAEREGATLYNEQVSY